MLAWVSALTHGGAGSKLDVSFVTSLFLCIKAGHGLGERWLLEQTHNEKEIIL